MSVIVVVMTFTTTVTMTSTATVDAEVPWIPPLGTVEHPTSEWFCTTWHDPWATLWTQTAWYGGGHSGIDLSLDASPWHEVERGEPVYAVSDGTVHSMGSSTGWLGVVVVKHALLDGGCVFLRYAHLDPASIAHLIKGQLVARGERLGVIGNYTSDPGEDHLHFDAALVPFDWNVWLAEDIEWVNPIPILQENMNDDALLMGMIELE